MANNFKPIIRALDTSVKSGESVLLSRMYEYIDLDGNDLRQLRLIDLGNNVQSGYFTYRGERLDPNQTYTFNFNELQYIRYYGGVNPSQELFRVQAYDGRFWSDGSSGTVTTLEANRDPSVSWLSNLEAVATETYSIGSYLRYNDPDGDAIDRFQVRYQNASAGRFYLDGEMIDPGEWLNVNANQLSRLEFRTTNFKHNSRVATLSARAYDGQSWSETAFVDYRVFGNNKRPVVKVTVPEIEIGKSIRAANIFNWSDGNGNSLKTVSFYDTGVLAQGGYFTVNGVRQDARQWFTVDYSDLNTVRYHSASLFDIERVRIQVSDGFMKSTTVSTRITTFEVPEISVDQNVILEDLEDVRLSTLFRQLDDGPAVRIYRIYDGNTDNRSAQLYDGNGNRLPQGEVIELTQSEFNQITIRGGKPEDRWHDEILIRAYNGKVWSDWDRINVYTESNYIDATLFGGTQTWWDPLERLGQPIELTYTFPQTLPDYYAIYEDFDPFGSDFYIFSTEQRVAARYVMNEFADVSGLSFRETTHEDDLGDIIWGNTSVDGDFGVGAYAYLPRTVLPEPIWGDIWVDYWVTDTANQQLDLGEYGLLTLIHEMGHAVGLEHPFQDNNNTLPWLPEATNTRRYTVMSYNAISEWNGVEPSSLMLYDMAAVQLLYGANYNFNKHATVYGWDLNERFAMTIWDGGGVDTIDLSNQVRVQKIDLRQGRFSSIGRLRDNVAIAFGAEIEKAYGGSNDDTLYGNEMKNTLGGNAGNDRLTGFGGNDILRGGAGNDTYYYSIGDDNDLIEELNQGGVDMLRIEVPTSIYNNFSDKPLENFMKFRRDGNDLQVLLTLGGDEGRGVIRIADQGREGSAVETLRLLAGGRMAEVDIDMRSLYTLATDKYQHFTVTEFESDFGFIATPV